MSTGGDDFLGRWSRRKQAARQLETAESETTSDVQSDQKVAGTEVEVLEQSVPGPSDPLPCLDDLTPEGDVRAFLRDDVPDLLRKAALRKMWSLDPAIRDHIGLAECTWDFNDPASIPGFGSFESDASVPEFLSRPQLGKAGRPEESTPPGRAPEATPPDEADIPPPTQGQATSGPETNPGSAADTRRAPVRATVASRHGGALPRE